MVHISLCNLYCSEPENTNNTQSSEVIPQNMSGNSINMQEQRHAWGVDGLFGISFSKFNNSRSIGVVLDIDTSLCISGSGLIYRDSSHVKVTPDIWIPTIKDKFSIDINISHKVAITRFVAIGPIIGIGYNLWQVIKDHNIHTIHWCIGVDSSIYITKNILCKIRYKYVRNIYNKSKHLHYNKVKYNVHKLSFGLLFSVETKTNGLNLTTGILASHKLRTVLFDKLRTDDNKYVRYDWLVQINGGEEALKKRIEKEKEKQKTSYAQQAK